MCSEHDFEPGGPSARRRTRRLSRRVRIHRPDRALHRSRAHAPTPRLRERGAACRDTCDLLPRLRPAAISTSRRLVRRRVSTRGADCCFGCTPTPSRRHKRSERGRRYARAFVDAALLRDRGWGFGMRVVSCQLVSPMRVSRMFPPWFAAASPMATKLRATRAARIGDTTHIWARAIPILR